MRAALLTLSIVLAATPLTATVAAPADGELTISATRAQVTHGQATAIRGKLKSGPVTSNVPVLLQHKPAPYTSDFETVRTTTTNARGAYSFDGVVPEVNTRYRVTAAVPQAVSRELPVTVRVRVVLRLSDRTPRAGERVKLRGTVAPEHDGRPVHVQRRLRGAKWRTVRKVALQDAGEEASRFSAQIRVRRDGAYRAKVAAGIEYAGGTSRPKRAAVTPPAGR